MDKHQSSRDSSDERAGRRTSNSPGDTLRDAAERELRAALELLSGRWVLPIMFALDGDRIRRTQLRTRLVSVSDKVLTDTLRRMEEAGLVERIFMPGVPPQVDYQLTDGAQALWPLLDKLHAWAAFDPDRTKYGPRGDSTSWTAESGAKGNG